MRVICTIYAICTMYTVSVYLTRKGLQGSRVHGVAHVAHLMLHAEAEVAGSRARSRPYCSVHRNSWESCGNPNPEISETLQGFSGWQAHDQGIECQLLSGMFTS